MTDLNDVALAHSDVTQSDFEALERLDDALGFLMHNEREIVLNELIRHRIAHTARADVRKHIERVAKAIWELGAADNLTEGDAKLYARAAIAAFTTP